ncbi:MAG: aquaporin [Chloroflexi bacterium]|nr:MAG: aquaporin [Chloroflexota bacterium]
MSYDIRNKQTSGSHEGPNNRQPGTATQQDQEVSEFQERGKLIEEYVTPGLAEFVGTFVFVFIGAGSIITNVSTRGAIGLLGIALAHGLALSMVVSAFGGTSGAHINPAVTIGFMVTRRITPDLGIVYIAAQLAGATLAGFLLQAIFPQAVWQAAQLGTPALAPDVSFGTGILVETILTFFLLLAVFGTAVDERAPKIGGFGIGLTVLVDILVGGPLTGAAMNPARTFGPALAGGFWQNNLVYWIGPILGAVLATLFYEYVILRWRKRKDDDQRPRRQFMSLNSFRSQHFQ